MSAHPAPQPATHLALYGLMAEFSTPEELLEAARRTYQEGYRRMDAYSPYMVEGLAEAIGAPRPYLLPLIILGGGILGAIAGFGMQAYASVISYPLNVGGRPYFSWPSFIPVTFELAILGAAFAAILGMFALNELPEPYHPAFNVPNFELASRNRFFLAIRSNDPQFNLDETRHFLESLGAAQVSDIQP
jgi:hypothetical protein